MRLSSLSKTFVIAGSIAIGTWFEQEPKAFALPQQQVVQTLQPITVFGVADSKGTQLFHKRENEVIEIKLFVSQQDTARYIENLQTQNSQLANQMQIVSYSLGDLYEINMQANGGQNGVLFTFVPAQAKV
ncbi:MAG: Tic22 family protein [Cyanophyceae cyanobacterium]